MSVLGLSGPPPPPPPVVSERDKSDRRIIVAVIGLAVFLVVAFVGTAVFLWVHYSSRYSKIDKSHETLSWDVADPSQDVSTAKDVFTTYANPPYGVSLKLPGKWSRIRPPYRCFITMAGSPGEGQGKFDAMFWPIFTGFPTQVETEANAIALGYSKGAGWQLQRTESMQINGRQARVMWFSTNVRNLSLILVVLGKGPVTYAVALAGPGNASDGWQHIESALPQSITIQ